MTAPKPATLAQPGQRFTDPDGGTWVLTPDAYSCPWIEVTAGGTVRRRSQASAEEANLVLLVAETELQAARDIIEQRDRALNAWADRANTAAIEVTQAQRERDEAVRGRALESESRDHWKSECEKARALWNEAETTRELSAAAPAPLDPDNPEDVRRTQRFLMREELHADDDRVLNEALRVVRVMLADRRIALDIDAAEQAHEADDRKLAARYRQTVGWVEEADGLAWVAADAIRRAIEGDQA